MIQTKATVADSMRFGCAVAASIQGASLRPLETAAGGPKPRLKLSKLQAQRAR